MKAFFKRSILLLIVVFLSISCDDKVRSKLFTGESGFSFKSTVLNVECDEKDNGVIKIPIYRGNTDNNTVNIECLYYNKETKEYEDTDCEHLFNFTTHRVIFTDNSNVAYAQIQFRDLESLGIDVKHKLKLIIKNNVSPSNISEQNITVNRKLTFELLGKCETFITFLFYEKYKSEIYKAKEADIYRLMDPFSEGLLKEDFVSEGWAAKPDPYIQIQSNPDSSVYYVPFFTGMMFEGKRKVYGCYPDEYKEFDYTEFNKQNKWIDNKTIQLYTVFYVPQYGRFECSPIIISLP